MCLLRQLCVSNHGGHGCKIIGPGGEDRGGRAGLDNFLSEEGLVGGGGESPSKAFAGQAGGDWPEGGRGGREAKLRPKPRANLGKPEES